jgi:hypothetical protein
MQSKNLSNPSPYAVPYNCHSNLPRGHDPYSSTSRLGLGQNAEHQVAAGPGPSRLLNQFKLCCARESRSSGKSITFPLLIRHNLSRRLVRHSPARPDDAGRPSRRRSYLKPGCAGRNGCQCRPGAIVSGLVDGAGPASHGRPLFSSEPENHADASGCAWKVDKFFS